jgi:CubicO group peptidase (beta-lactamase class C family)
MSRNARLAIGALILVAVPAGGFPVSRAIRVVTGLTSHALCSQTFITGFDPDGVYAEVVRPQAGVALISWGLRYKVDPAAREVRTSFLGMLASRAVYRSGYGCVVGARGASDAPPPAAVHESAQTAKTPAIDEALKTAKAVVVMRDGQIIAEGYAPGVTVDSRLAGWSASKSVINALVGILVRQGKLKVEQPAPVAEWANDSRREITIDQLLRMTAGLDLDENHSGFDPAARMLYAEPDMAAFAQHARLKSKPGTVMNYTDCNTVLLSRIIREMAGDINSFARSELFEPLGIRNMLIESDAAGTPVGSTHIFATARDWARLGMLYANDGAVNGRRILPEGWVQYSSQPTLGTRYASGFWTNVGHQKRNGLPADSFFASGHLGQKVLIVPSEKLVIARLAVIHKPSDGDMAGLARLYTSSSHGAQ